MFFNISMKLENLLENGQAAAILDRFLPGMLQKVQDNPQAIKLSVEQMVRYSRIPQGEALLQKLDAALSGLNTPENAVSPAEKQLIAFFHTLDEADKTAQAKENCHHQEAIYPGRPWLDTKGERIQAHGGAVFYEDGVYYWYGENKAHTDGKNGVWT